MIKTVNVGDLNLADHIRPGDMIVWGQASSEPVALMELLIEQRAAIGKVNAFIGLSLTRTLQPEHTDFISLTSYGALGTSSKLAAAGVLSLIPCHYSSIPNLMDSGRLPVDVVFVQLSEAGPDGTHSLGFCNDYMKNAINKARVVIADINTHVPWSRMDAPLDESKIDFAIVSDYVPAGVQVPEPGDVELKIAAHVASVIEDGATLQYGIGSIPSAILNALGGHKDLGLHSGLISEEVIDLVENGVITNTRKAIHTGISIGAIAIGGPRLKDFLHDNAVFEMHPSSVTHGPATLARIDNLVAMNSALEVDLYGQINAEQVGDRYLGGIGGQVDYMHAATTAANGISLIAMPASLGKSGGSRITTKLGGPFVTTCRTDVDMIVTEFGIADLRGKTLEQRAASIIDIALPEYRDELKRFRI
jgi:acyl-CoA hydrolase